MKQISKKFNFKRSFSLYKKKLRELESKGIVVEKQLNTLKKYKEAYKNVFLYKNGQNVLRALVKKSAPLGIIGQRQYFKEIKKGGVAEEFKNLRDYIKANRGRERTLKYKVYDEIAKKNIIKEIKATAKSEAQEIYMQYWELYGKEAADEFHGY